MSFKGEISSAWRARPASTSLEGETSLEGKTSLEGETSFDQLGGRDQLTISLLLPDYEPPGEPSCCCPAPCHGCPWWPRVDTRRSQMIFGPSLPNVHVCQQVRARWKGGIWHLSLMQLIICLHNLPANSSGHWPAAPCRLECVL